MIAVAAVRSDYAVGSVTSNSSELSLRTYVSGHCVEPRWIAPEKQCRPAYYGKCYDEPEPPCWRRIASSNGSVGATYCANLRNEHVERERSRRGEFRFYEGVTCPGEYLPKQCTRIKKYRCWRSDDVLLRGEIS